jgi:5-methylcytosine-specific restriction endonuclease McrA|tara:strand:- start:1203 stop:1367 length:165 start_codon:yes stop_codon:yes gene_type:complete
MKWSKEARKNRIEIDHKIPLSRDGENKIENLVVCCISCNRKKGTMTDKEFLQKH